MIKSKLIICLLFFTCFLLPATVTFAQFNPEEPVNLKALFLHQNEFSKKSVFKIRNIKRTIIFLPLKINYWKTTGSFGININQVSFSDNWSSGGVNSVSFGGLLNYKTEYNKEGMNFASELQLRYGKLKNQGQLERKTNDRIFFDNKAAASLSKNWSFFGSISFETQFDLGFTYKKDSKGNEIKKQISGFFSPGYITESFGFEYKPQKYFSLRIGTGTARQTFMVDTSLYKDNPKNFGVPVGKIFRNELAFQLVVNYDKEIAQNLNLKARYLMFTAYEKIKNIDQRLDITLTAKVNKLVNVTLNGTALYDDDFSGKIQSSQGMALGILFKMPH
jgi:hypothetical protein